MIVIFENIQFQDNFYINIIININNQKLHFAVGIILHSLIEIINVFVYFWSIFTHFKLCQNYAKTIYLIIIMEHSCPSSWGNCRNLGDCVYNNTLWCIKLPCVFVNVKKSDDLSLKIHKDQRIYVSILYKFNVQNYWKHSMN